MTNIFAVALLSKSTPAVIDTLALNLAPSIGFLFSNISAERPGDG